MYLAKPLLALVLLSLSSAVIATPVRCDEVRPLRVSLRRSRRVLTLASENPRRHPQRRSAQERLLQLWPLHRRPERVRGVMEQYMDHSNGC